MPALSAEVPALYDLYGWYLWPCADSSHGCGRGSRGNPRVRFPRPPGNCGSGTGRIPLELDATKDATARVRPDEYILAALSPEERLDAALRVAREAFGIPS